MDTVDVDKIEEKEIPEICVENPYKPQEEVATDDSVADEEKVELIYKPPRLFRKSLIYKTWKLFGSKTDAEPKQNRPLRENLWWLSIMLVGFLLAFLITDKAWQKFQTNPTFTSLVLTQREMKIVYPTVTICPKSASDSVKVIEFIDKHDLNGSDVNEIKEVLNAIPNFAYGTKGLKSVMLSRTMHNKLKKSSTSDLRALAFKLALSCRDIFHHCQFKGVDIDCCDTFLPVFTEHGFCYAFNTQFYGTPNDEVINKKLFTVTEFDDEHLGLQLNVPTKTYLNSFDESLQFEQLPVADVDVYQAQQVTISMQRTKSDANIQDLRISQRKCVFKDEVKLKYYHDQPYTMSTCLKECKIDQALEYCECLPPFYRPSNTKQSTFCDAESLKCLKDERIWNITNCDCQLSCDFTVFSPEKKFKSFLNPNSPENAMSYVSIAFEHWPQVTYHREVRFGFIDFLVAFGSILALFLSFSLLSAIEVLLYIVRFFADKICPKPS